MAYQVRFLTPEDQPTLRSTFLEAFSDYSLSMAMSPLQFQHKFYDKLGLELAHSPAVFHNQTLVGFIFTACDRYFQSTVAYNGGTGVVPAHRGQALVSRMYDLLAPTLAPKGITHCVLEVLTHNARAQKAYERVGFEAKDLLRCYKLTELPESYPERLPDLRFAVQTQGNWGAYIGWSAYTATFQDQWHRLPRNPHEQVLEAHLKGSCVGVGMFQPGIGRISALAVAPSYRGQGIAGALVAEMLHRSAVPQLTVINVRDQDTGLKEFFTALNFQNQINQYEMWLPLADYSPKAGGGESEGIS